MAFSENIENEWPCFVPNQYIDNYTESLRSLWQPHRVAQMESHPLGKHHALQCFLPADLRSLYERWLRGRINGAREG